MITTFLIFLVFAFLLSFFPLWRADRIVWYVVVLLGAAVATALFATWLFHEIYPWGSPRRNAMLNDWFAAGAFAAILGPILGVGLALIRRRKRRAATPQA